MVATVATQAIAARYERRGGELEARATRAATLASANPGTVMNRVAGDLDKVARCTLSMQMLAHRMSGDPSGFAAVERRLAENSRRLRRIDVERLSTDAAYAKRINKATVRLHRCVAGMYSDMTRLDNELRYISYMYN